MTALRNYVHIDIPMHIFILIQKFEFCPQWLYMNIMAKFSHCNLPYLFGFCAKNNSIVMSYHGIDNQTVSLHDVLYPSKSASTITQLVQITSNDWINILKQIFEGFGYLHDNYKIIHNDIKCDNIV